MVVDCLRISSFRNIAFAEIDLGSRMNCFTGRNGAGKTSVLEALYVISRGRTFRSASLDAVIQVGNTECAVGISGNDTSQRSLAVVFRKGHRSSPLVEVDARKVQKQSQVAAVLPIQLITPDCGDLVLHGPPIRRQYIDWGVFHVKQTYHQLRRDYNNTLRQRNVWLKSVLGDAERARDPWIELLSQQASEIDQARRQYCFELEPIVSKYIDRFGIGRRIEFEYVRGWSGEDSENLAATLRRTEKSTLSGAITRVGPHRADFRIAVDGLPANQQLSRGQAKLVAIAMKLGQAAHLNAEGAQKTIVLFDELVSELDSQHIGVVFDLMEALECQVLLSAVEVSEKLHTQRFMHAKMFHVEHGVVREILE